MLLNNFRQHVTYKRMLEDAKQLLEENAKALFPK
jgi:hypothetical protein